MRGRHIIPAAAVAAVTTTGWLGAGDAGTPPPAHRSDDRVADIQVVAVNDVHGNLDESSAGMVDGRPAGGVAHLASLVGDVRRRNRQTLLVSAGDLVGGSPLISSLFEDRPTIE